MGCMTSKDTGGGGKSSEDTFVTMDKKHEIKSTKDIITRASDFVIEYKDVQMFSQNYKLDAHVLGEGAFGRVQKCQKKSTGEFRAVKIIDKLNMGDQERVRLKYEIDILKNLNHPNIVRLYEVYENKSSIFLVTELCDGVELFDEIAKRQKFSELEAAIVTKQILQAIAYCHAQNVAHRDLKPENVLIDTKNKGAIKVIDFGTSHAYDTDNHAMHQIYGTPYYIAPEVLVGNYDEKCDLWSIGVILYIMMCGRPPFGGSNDDQIIAKVRRGAFEFKPEYWEGKSEEVQDLIRLLMEKDPAKRISAKDAIQHKWIQQKVKAKFDKQVAMNSIAELQNFRADTKLRQASLTFMVSHLSTKKMQDDLRKSFNQWDENGDGLIQRHEFINGYKQIHQGKNMEEVEERANAIFDQADVDGSGEIDFGEWCAATINKNELLNDKNLTAAFALFDRDGGGTIEAAEVAAILGGNMSKEEQVWQDVIKEVDINGDGQIDFEEFKVMMLKLVESGGALDKDAF